MIAIAIDGPAGAGKSTLARALAQKLGYLYVDTGALYRAIAYDSVRRLGPNGTGEQIASLLPGLIVNLRHEQGEQRVLVNGEDVTGLIRTPEMALAASRVSALPVVRAFLLGLQRRLAAEHSVVMDGRDIGTVILPDAQVKIFLTASAEERTARRLADLEKSGIHTTLQEVLRDVQQRDQDDSTRLISPLKQAEDAILVDTTGDTREQSIERLLRVVAEALELHEEQGNEIVR